MEEHRSMDIKDIVINRLIQNGEWTLKVRRVYPEYVVVTQVMPVPPRPVVDCYPLSRVAEWRRVNDAEYNRYLRAYAIGVR